MMREMYRSRVVQENRSTDGIFNFQKHFLPGSETSSYVTITTSYCKKIIVGEGKRISSSTVGLFLGFYFIKGFLLDCK